MNNDSQDTFSTQNQETFIPDDFNSNQFESEFYAKEDTSIQDTIMEDELIQDSELSPTSKSFNKTNKKEDSKLKKEIAEELGLSESKGLLEGILENEKYFEETLNIKKEIELLGSDYKTSSRFRDALTKNIKNILTKKNSKIVLSEESIVDFIFKEAEKNKNFINSKDTYLSVIKNTINYNLTYQKLKDKDNLKSLYQIKHNLEKTKNPETVKYLSSLYEFTVLKIIEDSLKSEKENINIKKEIYIDFIKIFNKTYNKDDKNKSFEDFKDLVGANKINENYSFFTEYETRNFYENFISRVADKEEIPEEIPEEINNEFSSKEKQLNTVLMDLKNLDTFIFNKENKDSELKKMKNYNLGFRTILNGSNNFNTESSILIQNFLDLAVNNIYDFDPNLSKNYDTLVDSYMNSNPYVKGQSENEIIKNLNFNDSSFNLMKEKSFISSKKEDDKDGFLEQKINNFIEKSLKSEDENVRKIGKTVKILKDNGSHTLETVSSLVSDFSSNTVEALSILGLGHKEFRKKMDKKKISEIKLKILSGKANPSEISSFLNSSKSKYGKSKALFILEKADSIAYNTTNSIMKFYYNDLKNSISGNFETENTALSEFKATFQSLTPKNLYKEYQEDKLYNKENAEERQNAVFESLKSNLKYMSTSELLDNNILDIIMNDNGEDNILESKKALKDEYFVNLVKATKTVGPKKLKDKAFNILAKKFLKVSSENELQIIKENCTKNEYDEDWNISSNLKIEISRQMDFKHLESLLKENSLTKNILIGDIADAYFFYKNDRGQKPLKLRDKDTLKIISKREMSNVLFESLNKEEKLVKLNSIRASLFNSIKNNEPINLDLFLPDKVLRYLLLAKPTKEEIEGLKLENSILIGSNIANFLNISDYTKLIRNNPEFFNKEIINKLFTDDQVITVLEIVLLELKKQDLDTFEINKYLKELKNPETKQDIKIKDYEKEPGSDVVAKADTDIFTYFESFSKISDLKERELSLENFLSQVSQSKIILNEESLKLFYNYMFDLSENELPLYSNKNKILLYLSDIKNNYSNNTTDKTVEAIINDLDNNYKETYNEDNKVAISKLKDIIQQEGNDKIHKQIDLFLLSKNPITKDYLNTFFSNVEKSANFIWALFLKERLAELKKNNLITFIDNKYFIPEDVYDFLLNNPGVKNIEKEFNDFKIDREIDRAILTSGKEMDKNIILNYFLDKNIFGINKQEQVLRFEKRIHYLTEQNILKENYINNYSLNRKMLERNLGHTEHISKKVDNKKMKIDKKEEKVKQKKTKPKILMKK